MIEWLHEIDQQLFIWLNQFHTPASDTFWYAITGKKIWIPFYLLIVAGLYYRYRFNTLWVLMGVGLTILLADQFASGFCKPFFERLRPSHAPDLEGIVHLIEKENGSIYRGGKYGFISSHAANTFGLSMFLYCLLRHAIRWVWLMFIWAALVSYSRIAVGVHYPGDILVGVLTGMLWGWLAYLLLRFAWQKWGRDQPLARPPA